MNLPEGVMTGSVRSRFGETFSFVFHVLGMNSMSCRLDKFLTSHDPPAGEDWRISNEARLVFFVYGTIR